MIVAIIITFILTLPIAIIWGIAIDKMPKDYKGDDFLNYNDNEEGI